MKAYPVPQHLERRTKIAGLTLPEWLRVLVSLAIVSAFWLLVPGGFSLKASVAVVLVAPAGFAAYLRDTYELGIGHRAVGALRRLVGPRTYRSGAPRKVAGYVLVDDASSPRSRTRRRTR